MNYAEVKFRSFAEFKVGNRAEVCNRATDSNVWGVAKEQLGQTSICKVKGGEPILNLPQVISGIEVHCSINSIEESHTY